MANIKGCLCVIFIVLLGGCSSRNALIPTPHLYTIGEKPLFENLDPELQTNLLDLMYVTDRLSEEDDAGNLRYGYGRSSSLAYGAANVQMGEKLSWEELFSISTRETRSSERPTVEVVSIEEQGRFPATPYLFRVVGRNRYLEVEPEVLSWREEEMEDARKELLRRLAKTSRKEIFIFVHGIDYSFDEAMEVVAEGYHFLGREGVTIAYTWPAGRGGFFDYAYDRESGEFTVFHLKNFISFLGSVKEVEKVHYIAHSRGTDVIMTALRELWLEIRSTPKDPFEQFKIGNVVLIAPDLDFGVTMQRLVAESVGSIFERMTIYSNINDDAIGAAKILFSSWLRLGALQRDKLTDQQRAIIKQMANLDIVSYQGQFGGSYGHSYFLDNPAVSSDILALLRYGWAPGKENRRPLEHLGGSFWRIDDDYPL